ncbi:MAG: FtsX-like permease family protein [Gammaproteobacteria bacterium]|nr:FtsX-like permease family protein [Gammaproteobacteria bacterium]
MDIKPIFSAMLRNKTGPILIALQVAITVAIVSISGFIISERIEKVQRPTGMDDANLVFAEIAGFGEEFDQIATYHQDLKALEGLPGVVSVGYMNRPPLTGGGSSSTFSTSPEPDSDDSKGTAYWNIDERAVDALGLNIIAGRNFDITEINRTNDQDMQAYALVTEAYAKDLFGEESAVDKLMYNGLGEPIRIVGVIDHMQGAWVGWDKLDRNVLFSSLRGETSLGYAIRVEPGLADSMVPVIETKLQEINRNRVVTSVRTLHEFMDRSYRQDTAMIKMLVAVSTLLVAVTSLGIVGLAAFNVNQRRKQIGTRRALGATRADILKHFLTEAMLITSVGAALGVALAFAMSFWLGTQFNLPKMDWWYVVPAAGGLLVIGVLSVLGPARRATLISPALATRSV